MEKKTVILDERHEIFYIVLLLFVALVISCYQITMPWFDSSDGAVLGHYARNFLRYGYIDTLFGSVTNSGPVVDGKFTYYIDHPLSLFLFLISISYRLFGVDEWSTRIVPIFFSMGNLVLTYIIANRLWNKRTAIYSIIFMAYMPMTSYFSSRAVWPYSMGIFFGLLVVWFYVFWIEEYRLKHFFGAIVCYVICLLSLWDTYFLGPILFIYHILTRNKETRLAILFPILSLLMFLAILVHAYFLNNDIKQLWEIFLYRTGLEKNISLFQFLTLESYRCVKYFTVVVCFLSLVGVWSEIRNRQDKNIKNSLLVLLFAWGIPYIILFREGAMHQIEWICSISPFLAITGALGLIFLKDSFLPKITSKYSGKQISWTLSFIAMMGCIILAFYRGVYSEIGWYSMFLSMKYLICITFAVGVIIITWGMSSKSLKRILNNGYTVTFFFIFLFLTQSMYEVYGLHQHRGHEFDYALARAINDNSEFEDAIITPLNPLYYYIPYYADRYIELNVRTKEAFFNVLDTEGRSFRYYITSNRELIKSDFRELVKGEFPGYNDISNETMLKRFEYYGIKETPCELDVFISDNYTGRIVGPWIIYDLSKEKLSL